ncbi:MAG: hypothetical protein U9Q83_10895, partial [Bacteroidota bacterium]|nr:hypothetical protein [Bacteroidota bacterium]
MSYIIKIPVDLIEYNKFPNDISFIAVKKTNYINIPQEIFLYRKDNEVDGLVGRGVVMGKPLKVSDIPKQKQKKNYDRSLLQVPISLARLSRESIIDEKYLFQLPGLNQLHKIRPYTNNVLQWCYIDDEINYLLHNNWWYFSYLVAPSENNWLYWLHILRERWMTWWNFKNYKKIITGKNQ